MTAVPVIPNPLTVARGGTGLQTVSSGRLLRGNGTGALLNGADLTFGPTAGQGFTAALGIATTDVGNRYTQTFNSGSAITHERHVITDDSPHADSVLLDYWYGTTGAEASVFRIFPAGLAVSSGGANFFLIQEIGEFFISSDAALNFYSDGANINFTSPAVITFNSDWVAFNGLTSSFPALRSAGAVLEVRLADDSAYTDLKAKDVIINGATNLLRASAALTDNAAASLGTLTNAPSAGNPTKWVRVDDNGTPRFIPCW